MEIVQFKTNIKCSGCVATVTPALNKVVGEDQWKVNLESPDKVLTVSAEQVTADDIKKALEQVGYKAEELVK